MTHHPLPLKTRLDDEKYAYTVDFATRELTEWGGAHGETSPFPRCDYRTNVGIIDFLRGSRRTGGAIANYGIGKIPHSGYRATPKLHTWQAFVESYRPCQEVSPFLEAAGDDPGYDAFVMAVRKVSYSDAYWIMTRLFYDAVTCPSHGTWPTARMRAIAVTISGFTQEISERAKLVYLTNAGPMVHWMASSWRMYFCPCGDPRCKIYPGDYDDDKRDMIGAYDAQNRVIPLAHHPNYTGGSWNGEEAQQKQA